MSTTLEPLTDEAIRRAELADPNSRRCLIENCSTTCAVELVHVFRREAPSRVLKAIEWNWGMRQGSLNLDTRQNVFFLGASLHELYKNFRWALLPEESDLDQYHSSEDLGFYHLPRADIPTIETEGLYKYRLIPIQFMEDVYLTRQSNDDDSSVTIHSYPFADLPIFTSHVNPRYVVLHLGKSLNDPNLKTRKTIMRMYPLLEKIDDLYTSWTHSRSYNENEPSFLPQPTILQPGSSHASDDVDRTPLRRIPVIASADEPSYVAPRDQLLWQREAPASTNSGPSSLSASYDPKLVQASRKRPVAEAKENNDERPRKRLLTYEALKKQKSRKDITSAKWTTTKISFWAQEMTVSSPPEPPAPSTSAPKPQPPRRSSRLLAKCKRRLS